MHSLETMTRLQAEAAERELARAYGRAASMDHLPLGPGRPFGLGERIRRLRTALLAVAAFLAFGCAEREREPDRSDPFEPPPAIVLRPVALVFQGPEVVGAVWSETAPR